jgi:MFS family permease
MHILPTGATQIGSGQVAHTFRYRRITLGSWAIDPETLPAYSRYHENAMSSLAALLLRNSNYRYTWMGQVVSEIGDYFNNVAVLALIMHQSGSGLVVSGFWLARAIPAVVAGPVAGVLLDRLDRRRIMISSDLVRAALALAFVATIRQRSPWLLYGLSAALMFASPFFTSGRSAILPAIAEAEDLHTANSLTQTTGWATLSAGSLLGGISAARFGYATAFAINALSFVFSAWCVWRIRSPYGFQPKRALAVKAAGTAAGPSRGWREYLEGLAYLRSVPLLLGIGMISVGWALGGGAAQVLFALFGEQVFHRGPAGIGALSGFAGIGLLIGGGLGHVLGRRASFEGYKRAVTVAYLFHGATYMLFSQVESYPAALVCLMLSRVGMAVTTVLNTSQLLRHTPDEFRGRVFATMETVRWPVMIFSMAAAGIASSYAGPRTIGLVAGAFGVLTACAWAWCDWTGRLPEP